MVSVGVGSGKIDQRFIEEDAYHDHQCCDTMRTPEDGRGRGRGDGEWEE